MTINDYSEQLKNEENTKKNLITPVIEAAWPDSSQVLMEYYFTDGRISVDEYNIPHRGKSKKADYLLLHQHHQPLAIVEAKGSEHSADEGYSQAVEYADILDVPFAFATNGTDLIERDMLSGLNRTMKLSDFPSHDELWERYVKESGLDQKTVDLLTYPYYETPTSKRPRHYQRIAINKTIEAIGRGQRRLLLVMATGTGKTFTSFQIIWRLWKTGTAKKVLYLADRNILIDQTMRKDFEPFKDAMVKYENQKPNMTKDIYLSLYQQLSNGEHDFYMDLPADFFDLVIVDECHRGSASEDSNWRKILNHFSSAIQIGMTATPKDGELDAAIAEEAAAKYEYEDAKASSRTSNLRPLAKRWERATRKREQAEGESNLLYFGEPVYTYSLKQGIEDGFLAPYKVTSVELNIDRDGYQPKPGDKDVDGNPLDPNRTYQQKDFDRTIVVKDRREQVAKRLAEFMKANDMRYAKTIVFCEDINHAQEMVRMIENENADLVREDRRYVMQITGDNDVGKRELDNFVDPYSKYPVIAVTSKLMATGVDAETCKIVVLDRTIGSMTEFKQIVGRGTRIKEQYEIDGEEHSKMFFNILDFRKNYLKFNDPDFDGIPVTVTDVPEGNEFPKPPIKPDAPPDTPPRPKVKKVRISGVDVEIVGEEVRYLDVNGNLVRQKLSSCLKNNIIGQYETEEDFYRAWLIAKDKARMADELLLGTEWDESFRTRYGYDVDVYDIVRYFGYDIDPPISKNQRTHNLALAKYLAEQSPEARKVYELLLQSYVHSSFSALKNIKEIFDQPEFKELGYTPLGLVKRVFGTKENYFRVLRELENKLYE